MASPEAGGMEGDLMDEVITEIAEFRGTIPEINPLLVMRFLTEFPDQTD
jgi:hypothetical protein